MTSPLNTTASKNNIYTYGKTEGKKFQLAEVKDANYRTEENPDSVAKVDNSHIYTYDANGNLVYVNTGRIKQDGTLDSTAVERKLRWDEENRLTASDDNVWLSPIFGCTRPCSSYACHGAHWHEKS